MDRREFLNISAVTALSVALPQVAAAAPVSAPEAPLVNAPWRTFEVVTEIEVLPQDLPAKVWLPFPQYGDTDYQRALDVWWTGNPSAAGIYRDTQYGAAAFFAQWDDRAITPRLQVTNRIATRNRSVDLNQPGTARALSRDETELYLEPTAHIPTDGIVRSTAARIVPVASTNPIERARAIYEWIVVNTYRDPKVIGCGTGDIRFMLESGGDTRLAPQTAKPLGHFMYPYAETAEGPLDYYNPQNFQYRISAREVTA